MRLLRIIPCLALVAGCRAEDEGFTGGDQGWLPIPAQRIAGELTWQLDFDEQAEGAGYSDCSYARSFQGLQQLDQPYLCPECDLQFMGQASMHRGFEDCYEPVFGGEALREEHWGLDWPEAEGGAGRFFRGALENYAIGELAELSGVALDQPFDLAWSATHSLQELGAEGEGDVTLAASGQATVTVDESTLLQDLRQPRVLPYACGWPLGNPGDLQTDWTLALDATFPRAWLEDACGDLVDLWDFHGSYLVIDSTQPDCGPCLTMADQAPDFLADMERQDISVRMLSLLGEGLSNVIGEPGQAVFEAYIEAYDHGDPILKDRGFGYAIFDPYWGKELSYPAWAVVRPDMTLLATQTGFSSWVEMAEMIVEDAGE